MKLIELYQYPSNEYITFHNLSSPLLEHWREYADKERKKGQRTKKEISQTAPVKIDWVVKESTAFKKSIKKYRNDKTIVSGLRELLTFIKSYTAEHNRKPLVTEYPTKLFVHPFTTWGRGIGRPNAMAANLKGQKIITTFDVDVNDQTIYLLHLGTPQALGFR